MRRLLPSLLVALALAAAGCGDDSSPSSSPTPAVPPGTEPVASTPAATAPPPAATAPGTGPVEPPADDGAAPGGGAPGDGEDGGDAGGGSGADTGDEQDVRVPAMYAVGADGRLEPPEITVPPFLAVEISVTSNDGRPHRVVVRTPAPQTLDLDAGGRAAVRVPGLRAGRYAIEIDGRVAGALVAGGEVGP